MVIDEEIDLKRNVLEWYPYKRKEHNFANRF